ncbi:MAG: hypothetical protein QXP01_02385 [Candidatus Hadarchaeum sp.]
MARLLLVLAVACLAGCATFTKKVESNKALVLALASIAGTQGCGELPLAGEDARALKNTLAKIMANGPEWLQSNLAKSVVGIQAVDMVWWAYHYAITQSGLSEKDPGIYGQILQAAMDGCIKSLDKLAAKNN